MARYDDEIARIVVQTDFITSKIGEFETGDNGYSSYPDSFLVLQMTVTIGKAAIANPDRAEELIPVAKVKMEEIINTSNDPYLEQVGGIVLERMDEMEIQIRAYNAERAKETETTPNVPAP